MNSSLLRERIEVRYYQTSNDSQGGRKVTNTPLDIETYAQVTQLSSNNSFFRGEINATMAFEVMVRYRKDLITNSGEYSRNFQMKWNGMTLNITPPVTSTAKGRYWVTFVAYSKA
jgi:head-tail adaptor